MYEILTHILVQLNGAWGAILGGTIIAGIRAFAISKAKEISLKFMLRVAKQAEELAFETGLEAMKFVVDKSYDHLPKWIRFVVSKQTMDGLANNIYKDAKSKADVEVQKRIDERLHAAKQIVKEAGLTIVEPVVNDLPGPSEAPAGY